MRSVHASLVRLASAALVLAAAPAFAVDYQSIGNEPAVLYDAPTLRGTKIAIAPRGMPVDVILAQDDWARVRDSSGGFSWVEKRMLVPQRTVVVTERAIVAVRAAPDDNAPIVFRVQPGVEMDVTSPPSGGWVAVRHRDGQTGFVRVGSVWGT